MYSRISNTHIGIFASSSKRVVGRHVCRPEENGKTLKFIPVLDIGVLWDPVGNYGYTRVYRKPTTSEIVMPWNDFGPTDWKTGTLIGFIRRAYTHSSDFAVMHVELQRITRQFRNVGYPLGLSKIRSTTPSDAFSINQILPITQTQINFEKTPLNFLPNGLYFSCHGPASPLVQ